MCTLLELDPISDWEGRIKTHCLGLCFHLIVSFLNKGGVVFDMIGYAIFKNVTESLCNVYSFLQSKCS